VDQTFLNRRAVRSYFVGITGNVLGDCKGTYIEINRRGWEVLPRFMHILVSVIRCWGCKTLCQCSTLRSSGIANTFLSSRLWLDCEIGNVQYVPRVKLRFHDPTLFGPDNPGFLFLGGCEANNLQCSYSQHSTLQTANQGNCRIRHSWCAWSNAAGNRIPLRCLQSHQCSPHRTSQKTWENYLSSLIWFKFNICTLFRLIYIIILKPQHDFWGTLY
jgi:hypothetical protein